MRLGRPASPRARRGADEKGNPCGPVAAELEIIVEVRQTEPLEIIDQRGKPIRVENRADDDEIAFNPELLRGQAQPLIDRGAHQRRLLVRCAPNEQRRRPRIYLYRHEIAEDIGSRQA